MKVGSQRVKTKKTGISLVVVCSLPGKKPRLPDFLNFFANSSMV
jgi:hypothetical protein